MQDSYVIKLSGKAELPESLEIGHNIRTQLEGSITAETISDNDDGTRTHYYKFQPIIVETIDQTGKRIKAKDNRRRSQQLRALLWKQWKNAKTEMSFESYYDKWMLKLMDKVAKQTM